MVTSTILGDRQSFVSHHAAAGSRLAGGQRPRQPDRGAGTVLIIAGAPRSIHVGTLTPRALSAATAYRGVMGMLGELFPGPKISDESGEDGDGRQWRLGPIDLDRGVVEVHHPAAPPPDSAGAPAPE